jgi:hypothetical protein
MLGPHNVPGDETRRFLEMFRSNRFVDVSLAQWLALTPPELVQAHLNVDQQTMGALGTQGQTDRGEVTGRGSGGYRGSPDDGKKGKSGVTVIERSPGHMSRELAGDDIACVSSRTIGQASTQGRWILLCLS